QNDRVLSRKKEDIPKAKATLSHGLEGVTSDGKKAPIIFVEESVKIDQAVYPHLLSEE
ncbi:Hypothetical protein FKW44_018960, partial [Caligus rogercresseyi]